MSKKLQFRGVCIKLNLIVWIGYLEIYSNHIATGIVSKKILIGVIYRPPSSSMADCIDKFENMLSVISNLRMPFFILGDFNID